MAGSFAVVSVGGMSKEGWAGLEHASLNHISGLQIQALSLAVWCLWPWRIRTGDTVAWSVRAPWRRGWGGGLWVGWSKFERHVYSQGFFLFFCYL